MKYDLKSPCSECPFRANSVQGWLGPDTNRPSEFINPVAGRIELQPGVFIGCEPSDQACHMDMAEKGTDEPDTLQHCAGALLFLVRDCKLPRDREKVAAMNRVGALNKNTPILGNVMEFLTYHSSFGKAKGKGKRKHA